MARPVGTSQITAAPRRIREIAERGLSFKEVAERLDIPVRNLRNWSRGHPEVKDALDEIEAVDNGVGGPSLYRPEYCQMAIDMGKEGKSQVEIAAAIGVSKYTLRHWESVEDDFADAMDLARTHSQAWWEAKGRGGLKDIGFNGNLWAKNMGPRFREDWSESKVTVQGDPDNPIRHAVEFTIIDPEDSGPGSEEA